MTGSDESDFTADTLTRDLEAIFALDSGVPDVVPTRTIDGRAKRMPMGLPIALLVAVLLAGLVYGWNRLSGPRSATRHAAQTQAPAIVDKPAPIAAARPVPPIVTPPSPTLASATPDKRAPHAWSPAKKRWPRARLASTDRGGHQDGRKAQARNNHSADQDGRLAAIDAIRDLRLK